MTRYYLDACIWLDFLEDRNEPGFPKSDIAEAFFKKVIDNNDEIIFSDAVKEEIIKYVRDEYVVAELLKTVASVIVIADSTMKEWNRAKEVSSRRNIPCFDSLHALLARKYNAVMITRDRHFRKLNDFVQVKSPEEFI
ncbi:PIN domain-containing protein [Candidatus Woesearchaeota archaeon]|nr:PIN domain-containing protein [Candidatus Woesearchaeota archaeon]